MFKIAIDLDKTICIQKEPNQSYLDVLPIPNSIETLRDLKNRGYTLIIHTARGMGTYNNDVESVKTNRLPEIIEWLKKWNVPFDEIIVGKPNVDFFIDDKAIEFKDNWKEINVRLSLEEQKVNNKK
jgi:capsule biosynthesis phosphatase